MQRSRAWRERRSATTFVRRTSASSSLSALLFGALPSRGQWSPVNSSLTGWRFDAAGDRLRRRVRQYPLRQLRDARPRALDAPSTALVDGSQSAVLALPLPWGRLEWRSAAGVMNAASRLALLNRRGRSPAAGGEPRETPSV